MIRQDGNGYDFNICMSGKPQIEGTVNRSGGVCIMSGSPLDFKYIRTEGKAGRIGNRLMAIVVEGRRGRVYLPPTNEMIYVANSAIPDWKPQVKLPNNPRDFKTPNYGIPSFEDLFTPRQLVALSTFSDLINEVHEKVKLDAIAAGIIDDGRGIDIGGSGAAAYADAIAVYLAFAVDRTLDFNNSMTRWVPGNEKIMNLFSRQAIPMVWDYGEANILANVVGGFYTQVNFQMNCLQYLSNNASGNALIQNASKNEISKNKIISTDPPYYDNIGYADLSDFFYIWLRRSLKHIFPSLFATMTVPKSEELIANPYRHGSKDAAETFFMNGMTEAMHCLADSTHPAYPVTIYYAFKQSETKEKCTTSPGWEAFLEAVIKAGFSVTGTWPMRSEQEYRILGMGNNALASSIILVCRKRDQDTSPISRSAFIRTLKTELPEALEDMTGGKEGATPIAPVDLAQAAIGPGMAIYSRHSAVLDADGTPLTVHEALILINKVLDEHLSESEGDLDPDSRFCIQWFEEYGWNEGPFGSADTLARAKGTSVDGVTSAGVLVSGGGKVRLLKVDELSCDWNPETDTRIPVWEALHYLCKTLQEGGEGPTGALLNRIPTGSQQIRQLAYRLYTLCERKGWAEDARIYNELITTWHPIEAAAIERRGEGPQRTLDIGDE